MSGLWERLTRGWRVGAAIIADEQAPTWAKPLAPGNSISPDCQPPDPPRLSPAPGFTPRELLRLAQADLWARECDPARVAAARQLADSFREHFPHMDDDDLGRALLNVAMIAREYALQGVCGKLPGTLSLAAAELTRLTRTEAPTGDR